MTQAPTDLLTVGELARRAGVATSAVRFYEDQGLISSTRTSGNQRRYPRHMLRRLSLVLFAKRLGIPLAEVVRVFAGLPEDRMPGKTDWTRIARRWRDHLDSRRREVEQLERDLTGCIGCGCLSLRRCRVLNPEDSLGARGAGPWLLLHPDPEGVAPDEPPWAPDERFETGSLALLPGRPVRARVLEPRSWGALVRIVGHEELNASIHLAGWSGADGPPEVGAEVGAVVDAVVDRVARLTPPAWVRLSPRRADTESFRRPCDFCAEPTTLSAGGDGLVLDVRSHDGPGSHTVIVHRACLVDRITPDDEAGRARLRQVGRTAT
ncbi:redox-sensitive transcriptional activator SoxR [Actinosynnema sp. NPDC023587]|uniref:redox-sensitive transcriptional activator SoxR n=1 Tax=Actinosynnema sp. NPDC023587 TaxID=3154695 RepID=UPI00340EA743